MPIPAYEPDIYADEAILNPYPHYARMRNLGPLVFLPQYNIYALPRYAEVKKALLSHTRFLSSHGVAGFTWPQALTDGGSGTLTSDEPEHSRFRGVTGPQLQAPALEPLAAEMEAAADQLVQRLVAQGPFDAMADFAQYLPITIVTSLVGLPERGRERMLDWAAASFDVLGVDNARARQAFAQGVEMIHFVLNECRPDTVTPNGFAAQIWVAVQEGRITPREACFLHVDLLAPALDTTIFATGHLLHRLATNPDQWAKLKADPALIPNAIDEAVRIESPIRAFGRVVDEAQEIGDEILPAGSRVLMMYASGNRDDRRWEEADQYRIDRDHLSGHLGFGQGRHICAGMHLAKLEMRSLLKALLTRVDRIEVGEPSYAINNVLRGFSALPARFVAAS